MSFPSKPKPAPRQRQRNQKTAARSPPEPPQKKDKRNILKLNLSQEESGAANGPQNEEFSCNELYHLGAIASDAFQTVQKDPSDCGFVEKVRIFEVLDKRGDISGSKVAEDVEKVGSKSEIVKPTAESGYLPLKMDNIVLEKRMEPEYIPETAKELRADGFEQTETEKDSSTLNNKETARANDQDFDTFNASDLKQSDLVCLNDDCSTLNDRKGSLSVVAAPGDDHSTLNNELDANWTAAGVQEFKKNQSDRSKPALNAAKDNSSALNDLKRGQDCTKGGICNLNQSDSPLTGCEDNASTLNEKIQQKTTTTTELDVDLAKVCNTNRSELDLEAAREFHSTLNNQSHANPTLSAEAISFSVHQISSEMLCQNKLGVEKFLTHKENVERGLEDVGKSPGIAQTASRSENAALETTAANHLSSEVPYTLATPLLVVTTPSLVVTAPPPEKVGKNVSSERTAVELESGDTLVIASFVVDTPSLEMTTPSLAVGTPSFDMTTPSLAVDTPSFVAPPPEKVGKNVEAKGTTSVTENAENAPINQKTILPTKDIINPASAIVATPISDEATPITSETTPSSVQTAPSTSELSCTENSSAQDTPPSEDTTPPLPTPPRAARLRGYLMKRGGALKAWKQRWFVFAEERNALVYFRTPRDLTPLGQVCLSHASFTCEGAEPGLFYLHTPERTVTLKAQSEELKFYWLQQLQLRRWIHRTNSVPSDPADTTGAELFPQLECAEEVNTEETTSQPLLLQLSLKHPLIELQNSVQILRRRSSNDCGQSVFHIPAPTLTPPTTPSTNQSAGMLLVNQEAGPLSKSIYRKSSPALMQATPLSSQTPPAATQTTPAVGQVTMRRRSRTFLRRSASSWSERSRLQQELQDQKDLVVVLQKALELCQSEKRLSRMDQSETSRDQEEEEDRRRPTESLEDLRGPTESLEDLSRRLEQSQAEVEELKSSLEQRDRTILELKKEVRELSEKNLVKHQVIQKLSSSVSQWAEQSSDVDQGSVQSLVQQNQDLQDDLKAFRKQNHFLNSEIHHLSGLWRTSTESQRVLMSKVSVQRGQYLRVLRELQEVSLREGSQSEALKLIIQDALSLEQSQLQTQGQRDQDQYGFQLAQDFEVEDIKLLIRLQAPDLKSTQSQEAVERPLVARWDQFMSSCRGELSPSPELKNLIRTGIPPHLRPQVWNWIIRTRTQRDQDPLQYQQLCEQMESSPQSGSRPWSRQIDLDLPRTLCTNHNFSSPSSPALQQLRRILLAFSWENPAIGYCQGLNRIAGLLLLVLGSEEDTFWALKAVVENIMPPEYYSPSLVGSQADQWVLKDFMAEKLPRLSSHLDRCGVDVSSSTFTWFLVVFVEVLPSHILLPLWDAFLYEGSKVLFRFSLALFKLKEPEIMQLSSPLELHQFFRVLPKTVPDYRRLSVVAFDELNPFSRRAVRSRRALHLERLQRELSDLRRQQTLFLSQRSTRRSTEDEDTGADQEEALDNNSEED